MASFKTFGVDGVPDNRRPILQRQKTTGSPKGGIFKQGASFGGDTSPVIQTAKLGEESKSSRTAGRVNDVGLFNFVQEQEVEGDPEESPEGKFEMAKMKLKINIEDSQASPNPVMELTGTATNKRK